VQENASFDEEGNLEQDSQEEALYANASTLWTNAGTGRVDINVCWENPNSAPGGTAAARAAWRDERRRAVEESFGRMGRVNFYGWDGNDPINGSTGVTNPRVCTSGAPGLHIVICNLPTDARCPALPASQTQPGGFPANNGLNNGVRLNPNHPASVAVHEFGHTLGFYHEEERPDSPNITSGPCAKQSWPNSNPKTYGSYDSTGIMSYCNPPTGAPWLSPNDVASFQRFYSRREINSLVSPRANCAASHYATGAGDVFFTWDCDEANRDQELIDTTTTSNGDARNLYMVGNAGGSPLCMGASSAANGATVRLGSCTTGTDWLFQSMYLRGFGGLCLDLQSGNTADGTPIQMWTCGALGGANQRWSLTRAGQIKYGTTSKCAKLVGGRLQLATCNTADNAQLFTFNNGLIKRTSSGNCLDVQGPSDAQFITGIGQPNVGTFVQEFSCNTALNQRWNFSGSVKYGANAGLCLNRVGVEGNGAPMTLATCNSSSNQEWDYYF
jgi:hypothetical protein